MKRIMHTLKNINETTRTANCIICGVNIPIRKNGGNRWRCKKNASKWDPRVSWCYRKYKIFRENVCARCGFIPEDFCQLDVHHKDGNLNNCKRENFETLCANCHRLITKKAGCLQRKGAGMETDTETTVVIFRVWKKGGDVIALFPADVWNIGIRRFCNSYQHIGQHGGADYQGVLNQTTPARLEDYHELKKELERIGYNLKVQKRFTRP